ncbi:MAG: DNA gyrase inhibitor YacG [Edaphobacter sp.]
MATKKSLRCPTCRTIVLATGEDFPFCSDRCRRIDLGKWASGDYKISTPIQDPDLLEELARSQAHGHKRNDED